MALKLLYIFLAVIAANAVTIVVFGWLWSIADKQAEEDRKKEEDSKKHV